MTRVTFLFVWLVIVAVVACPSFATAQPRIETRGSVPIEQLIKPGETELIVQDPSLRGGIAGFPDASWLAMMRPGFQAVIVADVLGREARLDESGTWITSLVSARVDEVVSPTAPPSEVAAGSSFVTSEEGGELYVGSTRVVAVVPDVRALAPGRRYLMFVAIEEGTVYLTKILTYEIKPDGRLSRIDPYPRLEFDDMEGRSLTEVLARIRALDIPGQ